MQRAPGLIGLAAITLTAAACSSGAPPVTAHGTLTVYVDPLGGVSLQEGYPDITDGGQVTVTDSSGKVIGTGALAFSQGQTNVTASVEASMLGSGVSATLLRNDVAVYTFTVSGMPGGLPRYGIKIGNRGVHWESASGVKKPGLTLGSP